MKLQKRPRVEQGEGLTTGEEVDVRKKIERTPRGEVHMYGTRRSKIKEMHVMMMTSRHAEQEAGHV